LRLRKTNPPSTAPCWELAPRVKEMGGTGPGMLGKQGRDRRTGRNGPLLEQKPESGLSRDMDACSGSTLPLPRTLSYADSEVCGRPGGHSAHQPTPSLMLELARMKQRVQAFNG
jgi:hypothetical protein